MGQIAALLAFSIGVFAPNLFSDIPTAPVLGIISVALAGLFYFFRQPWLISFLMGLLYGSLSASETQVSILPEELNNQTVSMTGYIKGIPYTDGRIWRLEFEPESLTILSEGLAEKYQGYHPDKIRLSYFGYTGRPFLSGQRLTVEAKLKRPHGFMNPGLFDYQRWLIGQGFSATGNIRKLVDQSEDRDVFSLVDRWRAQLSRRIQNSFVLNPAIQSALLIGDRQGISSELMSLFVETGTIHLMVISGLHIGFAGAIGFFLTRWTLSLLMAGCQLCNFGFSVNINSVRWASLASVIFAAFYAMAAGFSTPTVRAVVMLAALLLPGFFYLKTNRWWGLSLALAVIALMDPLAPLQNGFWLSFGAVVLIFASMGNSLLTQNPVLALVRMQLIFLFGFSTMILFVQGQLNLASLPANLLAVPITGLLVVPLEMLGLLVSLIRAEYSLFVWGIAGRIIELEIRLLEILHQYLQVVLVRNPLPLFVAVISVIAGLIFFGLRTTKHRVMAFCCMLPALIPFPRSYVEDVQLEVRVFDVGQGLAVLVRQPGYNLIYDTGARYSENFDTGADVLAPGLAQLGIRHIDDLIISHPDADHMGGYRGLVAEVPAERVWIGRQSSVEPINQAIQCARGARWQNGKVTYEFIHPEGEDSNHQSNNDRSCVLRISFDSQVILIPGDITAAVERRLLAKADLPKNLSLFIAPHHGSKSSSSKKFLMATKPEIVVFSAGYANRFGHPHADVVKRYEEAGSRIYNTFSDGQISFQWHRSSAQLQVRTTAEKRIFWWQK